MARPRSSDVKQFHCMSFAVDRDRERKIREILARFREARGACQGVIIAEALEMYAKHEGV